MSILKPILRGLGVRYLPGLIAVLAGAGLTARAEIQATIDSLAVTNYTGYLIASDADRAEARYNRDAIAVKAVLSYAAVSPSRNTNFVYNYALHFRLLDTNGVPQPLLVGDTTNTDLVVTYKVDRSNPIIKYLPVTSTAQLTPAGVLDPFGRYAVELQVYRALPELFARPTYTGLNQVDTAYRYLHFPSRSFLDSAANAIGELLNGSVTRSFLIAPSADQNTFQVSLSSRFYRYDTYLLWAVTNNVTLRYELELFEGTNGAPVALAQSVFDVVKPMSTHTTPPNTNILVAPAIVDTLDTVHFAPAAAGTIDPVNRTYSLRVRLSHFETAGDPPVAANSWQSAPIRFIPLTGALRFGDIPTTFKHVAGSVVPGALDAAGLHTLLAVNNQSGSLNALPSHTYGDGTPLGAVILTNGDAVVVSGTAVVTLPAPDNDVVRDVRYERTQVLLSAAGGAGTLRARYPVGFGHSTDVGDRILEETVPFAGVKYTADLKPAADLVYTPAILLYGCEASKPVWFPFKAVKWIIVDGAFSLETLGEALCVRLKEYEQLVVPNVPKASAERMDNSRYYQYVRKVDTPVVVRAGAKGQALLRTVFGFESGVFWPHFPKTTGVSWTGNGIQTIADSLVVAEKSGLEGVRPIGVPYARDCTADNCAGSPNGPETLLFVAENDRLSFTMDGGLDGAGKLDTPAPLHWGWIPTLGAYAQRTEPFSQANFLMPGVFLRADLSADPPQRRPASLLMSGMRPDDLTVAERPHTAGYAEGFADYPGLNFRVPAPGLKAESVIAAKASGLYPLSSRSKYYVRLAGVSGIHEAVFGQFPKTMKLYGYTFTFSNYGLSYLNSLNEDSRTDGTVYVPAPSDFTQDFENLKFSCLGAPGPAEVPADQATKSKVLSYWAADFVTHAIAFDRKADQACDPGAGFLTLGVEAYAQHIADSIVGTLGFWPNGNLITLYDCQQSNGPLDPPFDSRLKLPNSFKLRGPQNEKYTATPVNDAYLNNYSAAPGDTGFINVAAKLDVPFFEDLKVHIHTSATKAATNAPIYLMGGWPNKGFGDSSHNFFTENPYDTQNRGFPNVAGMTVDKYRAGDNNSDAYRVRAQRTWLEVVEFDYPLKWSSSTRAFTAQLPVKNNLVLLTVEHQVKYLSAKNAELKFGAQYDILPQANLANLAFDQLGGLQSAFTGIIQAQVMSAGLGALDELLDANLQTLIEGAINAPMDAVLDPLYDEIESKYNHATKSLNAGVTYAQIVNNYVTGAGTTTVLSKLKSIGQDSANVTGLIKEIADRVDSASQALDQMEQLLAKDGAGNRGKAVELIQNVASLASALLNSPDIGTRIAQFLQDADPTLEDIAGILHGLKQQIDGLSNNLRSGVGMAQELQNKLAAATAAATQVANLVQGDFNTLFASYKPGLDDPFQMMSKEDLKALLRQKIRSRLLASPIADIIHHTIKQQVYDLNASIRENLDSVFSQFNIVVRDLLSQAMNGISEEFTNFAKEEGGSGGIPSGLAAAGRIDGYAHIVGDSLSELRLDVRAKLQVPSEMKFDGYLRIRELNSENSPQSCIPGGGKAMEVTMGANDVKIDWISPDLRANVNAKFTFATSPKFYPAGFGAGFELTGPLTFETFIIRQLGAQMAFGETENYFSGAAAVEFNSYKGKGGIYFGRTCTLDPFFWDKDVQSLIGTPPFTGAYVYGEVWIPVSEALLGIPASCFFQVSAGVGAGAGFFIEGPTFIGKMFLGVSGDILCIVSVEGEVYLVGVKNKDGLALKGVGELTGSLGPCPFCISFGKSLGLTYKNSSWDVDF